MALKKLELEKQQEGFPLTALREIMILKKTKHKNIVTLHEVLLTSEHKNGHKYHLPYLVFDYFPHDFIGLLKKNVRFNEG